MKLNKLDSNVSVNGADRLLNKNAKLKAGLEILQSRLKLFEEDNPKKEYVKPRLLEEDYTKKMLLQNINEIKMENRIETSNAEMNTKLNTKLNELINDKIMIDVEHKIKKVIKRTKVEVEDKERLITAYQNDKSWVDLSTSLGIKHRTASAIIRRWINEGNISTSNCGGNKRRKITDNVGPKLIDYVQWHSGATLREMQTFLLDNYDITVSLSSISAYLAGRLLCVHLSLDEPEERNSDATKEQRFSYVKYLLDNNVPSHKCVFLGQAIYNYYLKKSYQESLTDSGIPGKSLNRRRRGVFVCMAVTVNDVLHYQIREDFFNNVTFQEFVSELSLLLGDRRVYFLMEERPNHYKLEVENNRHSVVYLPPSSSCLNPINAIFTNLKDAIDNALNSRRSNERLSLVEQQQQLLRVFEDAIASLPVADFEGYYKRSVSHYVRCIRRQDLSDDAAQ